MLMIVTGSREVVTSVLIAFSGFQNSGKDTAASVLIEEFGYTKIAFADALREMALKIDPYIVFDAEFGGTLSLRLSQLVTQFGWDKIKREIPEVRRLLQVMGTEAVRELFGENTWINVLWSRYPDLFDPRTRYVLTDCRFKNEADFVKMSRGTIYWIDRPGNESDGHASESTVVRDMAHAIVTNDGSVEDLKNFVRSAERGNKW
jgi:hypothetical protein